MGNCKGLTLTTASILEIRSLISGKSIISWNTATACVIVVKTKKVSIALCVTAIPFIDTSECIWHCYVLPWHPDSSASCVKLRSEYTIFYFMRALIPPFKPTVVCVSWFFQNFSHLRWSAVSTCLETNPHCLPIAPFLPARLRLDEDTLCMHFKCCIKVRWQQNLDSCLPQNGTVGHDIPSSLISVWWDTHEKERRAKTKSNNTIWSYFHRKNSTRSTDRQLGPFIFTEAAPFHGRFSKSDTVGLLSEKKKPCTHFDLDSC